MPTAFAILRPPSPERGVRRKFIESAVATRPLSGTVSGIDIPTLNRDGKSQLLFDDAPGQVRTQLRVQAPNSPHSSVSLGYLIAQPFSGAQRGSFRGTGFEATTDGWMSWRANAGMLISTTARTNGQSTQLDVQETNALAKGANDLGKRLNDSASSAKAHTLNSHTEGQSVPELIKAIDPKQDGKYTAPVNGQHHTKPTATQRNGGDPVERFAKPIVLLETPSSAALATPGLIAAYAGQDQSLIAQTDAQLTAAHTASLASGETTSLFTQEGGIQAIAANGPVSLKAHTGALQIRADKSVRVVSVNDTLYVQAKDRILLHGGASSIDLNGADILMKTPGSFTVKGAQHVWAGAGGDAASLPVLPEGTIQAPQKEDIKHWVSVDYRDPVSGEAIEGAEYELHRKASAKLDGTIGAQGAPKHEMLDDKPVTKVVYKPRQADNDKPAPPLEDLFGGGD